MKKSFLFMVLVLAISSCQRTKTYYLSPDIAPYEVQELTDDDLFSNNIEGPAFRNDTLFVVNYTKDGTIGMVFPGGDCQLYLDLPQGSVGNSIKFDRQGNMYVADFRGHNILKIDKGKKVTPYVHHEGFNQPNDIIMNSKDWIYASDPNWKEGTGQLWLIKKEGEAILLADSLGTTNGIALSPDEKQLYVGESKQLKIWRFDVDDEGMISNKQLFTTFEGDDLDGMHFGPNGNLFVARYGKGTIEEFTPQGERVRLVKLKHKKCSNFVFGDPDGKTVFVTLQDKKGMEMFRIE